MTAKAIPVQRGCGYRVQGGLYVECGLSPAGRPVEDFLLDPPIPLDSDRQQALGIRPVGVTLVPDPRREGVHHVFDWVGSVHYANVADVLEEVRRFGLSRRLPRNLDFSLLSRETRHVLVHASAWIDDPTPYFADRVEAGGPLMWCPKILPEHMVRRAPPPMCGGLWWEDVEGGIAVSHAHGYRAVERTMPAFRYLAKCPPPVQLGYDRRYTPAAFASFPISRVVVVSDPAGGTHLQALERAGAAARNGIPVEEVEC